MMSDPLVDDNNAKDGDDKIHTYQNSWELASLTCEYQPQKETSPAWASPGSAQPRSNSNQIVVMCKAIWSPGVNV